MKPQCIDAVNSAVGRELNEAELKGVEERITRHLRQNAARDPQATLAMTPEQRFVEAAKTASEEFQAEQAKKAQRVALQVMANAKIEQHLSQFGGDKLDGLARVVAFHADGKGNFLSVESQAKAIERDSLRQMIGTMEATNPKFFGLFENKDGVRALVKELFGEDSGVKEAKDGAAQFKAVAEALRQRFNRGGGEVGQLEDWGMPHHHSQLNVAKAGREQWIADILPRLDRSRYTGPDGARMTDQELDVFLTHAWETIATGGVNKIEPGRPNGSGMRANRGNEGRQIHFKDADSYLGYQEKYGDHTPYEVMVGHISGVSKDIALVETLGPNPDHAFRMFRDIGMKEATLADPAKAGKVQKQIVGLENLYNLTAGKTLPVASEHLAKSFDTLRSWLVASRLGSAVISSLSDEATLYLTAHVNNLPELRVFANELSAMNPANQMEKRMALRAGLAMNTMISSLNRFGQDGLGASFSSKLASSVLRASGLNALTEARKRAFGVTMMSSLGQITKDFDNLGKLDKADHRILLSKGITETEFAVWRKAALEDWGGGNSTMLTPESIYRIPDEALKGLADDLFPNMPVDARTLKERAATKLLGVVLEETDVAVIEPGVKERALMLSNLQRGTWKGELSRSFFLFKSFPIAMLTRHWMRGMNMETSGGKAAYIASLMAGTTMLGAAALQINEVLSGRDPRNMNPAEKGGVRNWIQAMMKGGSLGIYGDFLFSESTQHGQSPVASVMGPVIGMGEDLFNLTQGNLVQLAQGKTTHAGAELVKFAKSNMPGANLWYTKAALDHMVFHQLQEYFSPGYLATMRSRAYREFGQQYWWEPGQVAPDRAPNPAAAVGWR
jgi:hypothetical protein